MDDPKQNKEVREETLISAGLTSGYFSLVEGVFDPGILKCIFTAGGPGSGKTAVADNLFDFPPDAKTLSPLGLKPVTSDNAFVHILKKAGIDPKTLGDMPDDLFKQITNDKDPNSLRSRAKRVMAAQLLHYQEGRLGLVIDGSGDEEEKMYKKKARMEALGYDCYMVLVQTSLRVAQERNRMRDRVLPADVVEESWHKVIMNIFPFQEMFGRNFVGVVNDKDTRDPEKVGKLHINKKVLKHAARFIKEPIVNPLGKKWIYLQRAAAKLPKGTAKKLRTGNKLNQKNENYGKFQQKRRD